MIPYVRSALTVYCDHMLLLCGIVVVKAEYWQFVSAAAVTAVVSNGTQLAHEHCCSSTQHFYLSLLSICLYWLVAKIVVARFIKNIVTVIILLCRHLVMSTHRLNLIP